MPGPENVEALEAALDELYGVGPTDFVETRKRLAVELRAGGDKDTAKMVVAARRPTTAAWALNQLSRTEPELVEVFLARSRELQAAQTGELAGGREAVRDATRVQRSVLAEVTEASVAMLGDRATDAYRTQILSTLHAASADEGVADQLRRGRLVREVSGSTGFPEAPSLTLVPDLEPRPRAATPKRPKRAPIDVTPPRPSGEKAELASQRRSELERAALQQTKRRLEAADAEAESAQETAVAAEAVAGETRARVIQLQDDLEAARREARSADDTAARARREATRLARAATKLRSKG